MDDVATRQLLSAADVDVLAGVVHRLIAEVSDLRARVAALEGSPDGADTAEYVARILGPLLTR